jgi:hypothetical protein
MEAIKWEVEHQAKTRHNKEVIAATNNHYKGKVNLALT